MENQKNSFFLRRIFQGRLGRKNFFIATLIIYLFPPIVAGIAALVWLEAGAALGLLSILTLLGFIISLPITMRRIQDTGHPGWLLFFFFFAPLLGPLAALVVIIIVPCLFFWPGNKIINEYGSPDDGSRGFLRAILNT